MPVASSLEAVGADLELAGDELVGRVEAAWRACVPPALTERSEVRHVRAGRLVVATRDPAVASQLRYVVDTARAAIGDAVGPDVVTEITIVVDPS